MYIFNIYTYELFVNKKHLKCNFKFIFFSLKSVKVEFTLAQRYLDLIFYFMVICLSERIIMSKKYKHSQKHLTLSDRIFIEQELVRGSTFKYIANFLSKDPTTISKEVKLHRESIPQPSRFLKCKRCSHYKTILLPRCTQKCVIDAINNLCNAIGISTFRKYFPVILTDNGPEFKNP